MPLNMIGASFRNRSPCETSLRKPWQTAHQRASASVPRNQHVYLWSWSSVPVSRYGHSQTAQSSRPCIHLTWSSFILQMELSLWHYTTKAHIASVPRSNPSYASTFCYNGTGSSARTALYYRNGNVRKVTIAEIMHYSDYALDLVLLSCRQQRRSVADPSSSEGSVDARPFRFLHVVALGYRSPVHAIFFTGLVSPKCLRFIPVAPYLITYEMDGGF